MTYLFNLLRMKEIIKKNIKGIHFNAFNEFKILLLLLLFPINYSNIIHFNLKIHVRVGIVKQSKHFFG